MFCGSCGAENGDLATFCVHCGKPLQAGSAPPAVLTAPGGPRAAQPVGFAEPPTTSGKAVASLICGFLFYVLPVAIVGIILGHISLSDIRKSGGRLKGHGIAVAGLVLGYLGVATIPFILIIAAIAIPNILRARMAANEASAIGSLRTVVAAADSYATQYNNGYPPSLDALAGMGTASCDHAGLINGELASGFKYGYTFEYEADSGATAKPPASGCSVAGGTGFTITAEPVTRGTTGQRSFFVDQSGVIRAERNGPATADSAPLE